MHSSPLSPSDEYQPATITTHVAQFIAGGTLLVAVAKDELLKTITEELDSAERFQLARQYLKYFSPDLDSSYYRQGKLSNLLSCSNRCPPRCNPVDALLAEAKAVTAAPKSDGELPGN
jgi:hypothetical protein